jgi:hypothetical protein
MEQPASPEQNVGEKTKKRGRQSTGRKRKNSKPSEGTRTSSRRRTAAEVEAALEVLNRDYSSEDYNGNDGSSESARRTALEVVEALTILSQENEDNCSDNMGDNTKKATGNELVTVSHLKELLNTCNPPNRNNGSGGLARVGRR